MVDFALEMRKTYLGAVPHLGAHVDDVAGFVVEYLLRQAKGRNVEPHQPAGLRVLLVDDDFVAERQEVVRDRE